MGVIDLSNIRYSWSTRDPLSFSLSHLTVNKGEHLFIQGASGSGKSTLLGILAGVLRPDKGEVVVLGEHLEKMRSGQCDRFRADHLGYVFQMFNLVPYLSIVDNVLLALAFSPLRRKRLAAQAKLPTEEAERLLLELGLPREIQQKKCVRELSIGQQQRVAVARALLGGPEILICDEPTSSLDEEAKESFVRLLFSESREHGSTVVFVSHDRTLAQLFPRRLHLREIGSFSAKGGGR